MKKVFFTVLFALICTMGFSQVSFNVKAGLNLSSYIGENSDHSEFKPGARIGVGMEYQFNDPQIRNRPHKMTQRSKR